MYVFRAIPCFSPRGSDDCDDDGDHNYEYEYEYDHDENDNGDDITYGAVLCCSVLIIRFFSKSANETNRSAPTAAIMPLLAFFGFASFLLFRPPFSFQGSFRWR